MPHHEAVRRDLPTAPVVEEARLPFRAQPWVRRLFLWGVPLLALILLKAFVIGIYAVPSGSMQQTLQPGDRMLVQRTLSGPVERGDVIVFDGSGSFDPARPPMTATEHIADALGSTDDRRMYVKRVLAVGGDTIACCDTQGRITITRAGQPTVSLDEPYLFADDDKTFPNLTVPDGYVWVLGDHRAVSKDSRAFQTSPSQGLVPLSHVQGHVIGVFWPFDRRSGNPSHTFTLPF